MKIAIIGTGNIGATLARQLAALGDDVSIANSRGPETLTHVADQTGATPVATTDIADDTQVVILAVPQKAIPDLASAIRDRLPHDVVVVDAGNYVPTVRDGAIPELDGGMVESRWTWTQLRHPIVKAFNTIAAPSLRTGARPAGAPDRIAAPVAGDDTDRVGSTLNRYPDLADGGPVADHRRGADYGRSLGCGRACHPAGDCSEPRHPGEAWPDHKVP